MLQPDHPAADTIDALLSHRPRPADRHRPTATPVGCPLRLCGSGGAGAGQPGGAVPGMGRSGVAVDDGRGTAAGRGQGGGGPGLVTARAAPLPPGTEGRQGALPAGRGARRCRCRCCCRRAARAAMRQCCIRGGHRSAQRPFRSAHRRASRG